MNTINPSTIRTYVKELEHKGHSSDVIRRKLNSSLEYVNWAYQNDQMEYSVFQQVKDEIANYVQSYTGDEMLETSPEATGATSATTPHTKNVLERIPFVGHRFTGKKTVTTAAEKSPTPVAALPPTNTFDLKPPHFIGLALVLLIMAILGAGIYERFYSRTEGALAYPSVPSAAGRALSFQGRLTDSLGNPITTATNMRFRLYDAASAGTTLYDSGTCSISPDQDGIHNVLIGDDCGAEIASSVFTENTEVWMGVTVGSDAEMTPRQQIANVPYAINAETLQGLPPGTGASNITYINQGGDLLMAAASPQIGSTFASETFIVSSAQAITIQSAGSGDVTLTATESGTIKFLTGGSQAASFNNSGDLIMANGNQIQLGNLASNPTAVGEGSLYYNTTDDTVYFYNGAAWVKIAVGSDALWQVNLAAVSPAISSYDVLVGSTATSSALVRLPGTANENGFFDSGGSFGIGTKTPDRRLDVLHASSPQLRLTQADNTVYTDFQTDNSGNLTVTTTGSTVTFSGDTVVASDFSCIDCLDFAEFADTLTLDAALTLNQGTNIWTQNFTGTTTTGYTYNADSLTSGIGDLYSFDALTSGRGISLTSTSTTLTSGQLLSLDWSPGSTTTATGDLFRLNVGANGNVTNLFNITDNGTSVFRVAENGIESAVPHSFTAAGGVSIAHDMLMSNQTASYIKSNAPLTIEAGETFESNDLTLKTYNSGDVILDAGGSTTATGTVGFYDSNVKAATVTTPIDFADAATSINTFRTNFTNESLIGALNEAYSAATGGGAGSVWTDSGTNIYLTTSTDEVVIGGTASLSSAKLSLDGDADQIQLIVQGNGTQTTSLAVFENSAGADQFTISNTGDLMATGDLAVNGGDITTSATTFNLLNATTTTLNIGGAATTLELGAATGTTSINNSLTIDGNTTLGDASGDTVTANAATWTFANDTNFALSGGVNGLSFDGTTFSVDATNDKIGIGTAAPDGKLHVTGAAIGKALAIFNETGDQDIIAASASGNTRFRVANDGTVYGGYFADISNTAYGIDPAGTSNFGGYSLKITGGALLAYDAGSVGIGITSPSGKLHVVGDETRFGAAGTINFATGDGDVYIQNTLEVDGTAYFNSIDTTFTAGSVVFAGTDGVLTQDNASFFWDNSSKELGIGTAAPDGKLHVTGAVIGKALAVFNETGDQNILVASASGVTQATLSRTGDLTLVGDLAVNGGDLTTTASTFNLLNATATTLNIGGAATTVELGAATGTTSINNALTVDGNTIGLNSDAHANNLLGIAAAGGAAGQDLYWGNRLTCDASETNCGWLTSAGAVTSLAGTANQITASASTGAVTLSIPSDFRAPGTVNAVSGIYTGAGAGTQRLDASGNLANIGNIVTSGTTGISLSGNGAGMTFSGTGTHAISASAGTLQLGAVTLGGAVAGNSQTLSGLGTLSFGTGNVSITGTTVGLTSDTNLLSLAADALTINGTGTLTSTLSVQGNTIGLNNDLHANNLLGIAAAGGAAGQDLYWGSRLACDASETNCGWLTSGGVVTSIAGTANQITASASTGAVTLSIPSDFRAPGTVNAVSGIYTGAGAGTQRLDASGNLVNIVGITASGTVSAADFTCTDCLDFTEFADTLALDAALTLNQSTNTWTQNFTGTTTTGLTYNANSLTTGTAMAVASTSTAFTSGSLLTLDWSPGSGTSNDDDLFRISTNTNGVMTGKYLNFLNNAASIFSVAESGNLITAGDLAVNGGDITSTGDLTIDAAGDDIKTENRLTVGSTTAGVGKLNVTGAEVGKALAIFNETGNQNILVASDSGTGVFSIGQNGDISRLESHAISGLPDSGSIVQNASFELDNDNSSYPDGWTESSASQTTYTTTGGGHGEKYMTVNNGGSYYIYSTCIPIAANQTYTGSARARNNVINDAMLRIRIEEFATRANCESRASSTGTATTLDITVGANWAGVGQNFIAATATTSRWGRAQVANVGASYTLDVDGVRITPSTTTSGLDLAETYPASASENIQVGEIVSFGTSTTQQDGADVNNVIRSSTTYDKLAFGVIATKPGLVLDDDKSYEKVQVALKGRVPVLVTTENGPINIGDPITTSSIPGVGMKATRSGRILGYAMTEWTSSDTNEIDQVTLFVNPETYIDLSILMQLPQNASRLIKTAMLQTEKLIAQAITATNATIDSLIVDTIVGRSATLTDAQIENLNASALRAQQIEAQRIKAESIESESLETTTLSADTANITGTLTADHLDATNIREMRERLEKLAAAPKTSGRPGVDTDKLSDDISEIQSYITQLTHEKTPDTIADISTYQLLEDEVVMDPGTTKSLLGESIQSAQLEQLTVTGTTSMTSLTVADAFSAGDVFIQGNSILSMNSELKLGALERVSIMNGAVMIAANGTITAKGEVISKKGFAVETEAGDRIAEITETGSATFTDLALDTYSEATHSAVVIAARDNYRETGLYAPAIKTNAQASGNGILPSGENDILIFHDKLTASSKVSLTPTSSTLNKSLYVDRVETCPEKPKTTDTDKPDTKPCRAFFRVALDDAINRDITFNWLIIH